MTKKMKATAKKGKMKINSKVNIAAVIAIAAALILLFAGTCFATEAKPRLVAHGGGFIEGYMTTNSVEAVMESIAEGYKLIELDIDFSSDGKLIMIHDWDRTARTYFGVTFKKKLRQSEFEKILIDGKFHTLTFDKLTTILDGASDVRIVTDVKSDNIGALTEIAEKYPGYVDRIIPQIYSYDQYDTVKNLGYRDIILTLYAMPTVDYDELMGFIRSHELYAVTVGDTHEYQIPDLKAKLASDGVTVYYHPVNDFETAMRAMDKGVYGVYANELIPSDFEEPARSYYLLDGQAKLCDLTLEEKSIRALKDIKIKNGAGMDREYLIDGEPVTDELVTQLSEGEHDLKLTLSLDGGAVAELDYLLWSGASDMRVLDKRYEYRIKEVKEPPDMYDALQSSGSVSAETIDMLLGSLVVKAGEHYGYCDGKPLVFLVGDEYLYTQKYTNGAVISPLADCIKAVGADSVRMDGGRYVYVYYDGARTMMQADTSYISRGIMDSNALDTPLTIYRDKVMASGEIYKAITGRDYIDNQEIMILLPEGVKAIDVDAGAIFNAAGLLFD